MKWVKTKKKRRRNKEKTRRVLRIQLTGRTFNDNQVYLGTFEVKTLGNLDDEESRSYTESVKMNEFIFVGHVYEEIIKWLKLYFQIFSIFWFLFFQSYLLLVEGGYLLLECAK